MSILVSELDVSKDLPYAQLEVQWSDSCQQDTEPQIQSWRLRRRCAWHQWECLDRKPSASVNERAKVTSVVKARCDWLYIKSVLNHPPSACSSKSWLSDRPQIINRRHTHTNVSSFFPTSQSDLLTLSVIAFEMSCRVNRGRLSVPRSLRALCFSWIIICLSLNSSATRVESTGSPTWTRSRSPNFTRRWEREISTLVVLHST